MGHFEKFENLRTKFQRYGQESGQPLNEFYRAFTVQELEDAVKECSFYKAIGDDGFDGRILNINSEIRCKVLTELTQMMNSLQIPQYFSQGRLIPLSKKSGTHTVELGDIRPIVVRSHLTKIIEKAILRRIQSNHQHLLSTGAYQTGFKQGRSTHINLTNIILQMSSSKKQSSKRLSYLFVDFSQAYNSIKRDKIFEILFKRCKGADEEFLVNIIIQLHNQQQLAIGDTYINLINGVAQGSVLSPYLFNIALDEALRSQPLLCQMIKRGDILAYADDIVVRAQDNSQLRQAIIEIDNLKVEWGLRLNRKKCQILAPRDTLSTDSLNIEGIQAASKIKYLGIELHSDLAETKVWIKNSIRRNLLLIKGKLRSVNAEIKEALLGAYCRSLILYYCTPVYAAGMWQKRDIDSIENEAFREMHLLPRDIPRAVIMNVARIGDPASLIIERISKRLKKYVHKQRQIQEYFQTSCSQNTLTEHIGGKENEKKKYTPIFLPVFLTNMIWAVARKSTCIHYGEHHFCLKHQQKVDMDHLISCDEIKCHPDTLSHIQALKQSSIYQWENDKKCSAILQFTQLALVIQTLEKEGKIKRVTTPRPVPSTQQRKIIGAKSAQPPLAKRMPQTMQLQSTLRQTGLFEYPVLHKPPDTIMQEAHHA